MPRNLPFAEVPLIAGINSNFDPETQAFKSMRSAQNVDTFDKFRAIAKVPGSTRVLSSAIASAVVSLHQFEYTALTGVRTRKQVAASAAGLFYDVTGGTAVSLSIPAALQGEAMCAAVMLNRIHLSSENLRSQQTGGIKYDGAFVRRWGVVAPGGEKFVANAINEQADWTGSADVTKSNSTISRDGAGSVQVLKTGSATTEAYIEDAGLGLNLTTLSNGGGDEMRVWVFLPPGSLQGLASSGTAVQVRIGNAGLGNSNSYNFAIGELVPGWNLLAMDFPTFDSQTGTGAVKTAIDTIRLRLVFASTAAQPALPFLWDTFYVHDNGAPTTAEGLGNGAINATVTHRVTFLTENGVESNGGPASDALELSSAAATASLNITTAANNDTVTLGSDVYTFKTALTPLPFEVLIGSTADDSATNFAAAVNLSGSPGTQYGDGTSANAAASATTSPGGIVNLTARVIGSAGDSITFSETGAGMVVTAFEGGADGINAELTNLPVSPDPQVIARRIYRDKDGDRLYLFVAQVDNNIDTSFTDDVPDSALGGATMPVAGDDQLDSTPPDRMRASVVHENRIFGVSGDNPSIILISDVGAPEEYRLVDQLTVDEELTGLRSHPLGLVLYGRTRALLLTGDGVQVPFRVDNLNTELGANNFRCVIDALGQNIVMREEEVYQVADPRDSWLLNTPVLGQFRDEDSSTLEDAFAVHDRQRYRFLFFLGSTIWQYQYGTIGFQEIVGDGAGTGPKDLRIGAWTNLVLPAGVTPLCAELVEPTANKGELWIGAEDGFIYFLQDPAALTYATSVSEEAVEADMETHAFPLNENPNGRGEPRYLLLNSDSSTGITWNVTVTVLSDADGAVVGSTTFNFPCPAGVSTPILPIPPCGAIGSWVRIRFLNISAEETGIIRGARVFYIPRGAFRGTRSS